MITKNKKNIIIVLNVIFSIILIYSVINIIKWNICNKNNSKIQENLNDAIKIEKKDEKETSEKKDKYVVDFEKLKKQNSDTIAYLKVPNTKIDTVVVRGKDNNYYLNHNFDKKINSAGWVFANYKNKFNGTDKNIVIFGHNSKNGSMLGTLKNTLNSKWYSNKENLKIIFITEKEEKEYEVFSIYEIAKEEYYLKNTFKNDAEYIQFLNNIKDRSTYDFKIKLNKDDKILTLSTCNKTGNGRVVLHAKKI